MKAKQDIIETIDVEELIRDFKVLDIDIFIIYLKEVWRDLAQRSDEKVKGINKITFSKYYELPGIICDRLFAVFDTNNNEYLDLNEFCGGMKLLFSESYDRLINFIFDFYDFNKDGRISKEDVRVVLSYVTLKSRKDPNHKDKLKFEQDEFKDRVESQNELDHILEKSFNNVDYLDKRSFASVVENLTSDIFLFILIFLLENKPFNNDTIKEFQNHKKLQGFYGGRTPIVHPNRHIVSPNINSKFRPSLTISKSPMMKKRNTMFIGAKDTSADKQNYLLKLSGKQNSETPGTEVKLLRGKIDVVKEETITIPNKVAVSRKMRHELNELDDKIKQHKKYDGDDIPLTSAFKSYGQEEKFTNAHTNDEEDLLEEECSTKIKHQGYMYKITHSKKLKKLWFKLIYKDLYYFRSSEDINHKGMHNLSGVYIKEEYPITYDGLYLFSFAVIYPKKTRVYYVDNEPEYQTWLSFLRKAIGYANLNDLYEIREKLGNGKFGLVRLGIHRQSGRKVAVKIMSKKDMTLQDLELVRTEIEVLKIAQHPNIVRLYDIFENVDYIYLIMEYCAGGDLFSYIEARSFKLPEYKAAQLVHKLATAVFYLHQYGIAHRDLKPENILMTDTTDNADIRLLDFGLGKIIGPNETCCEPYGTLSYVAPEVLLERPYNKSVDLWSLGIITYLLLCGCLPFDDENSEREIARQTIHDPVPYPSSIWQKLSQESRIFVNCLLQKDPTKRITLKQVLEHQWLKKYNQKAHDLRRDSKDMTGSFKLYATDVVD